MPKTAVSPKFKAYWLALAGSKLGETAVLGMQLIFFLSAFSNVFCKF